MHSTSTLRLRSTFGNACCHDATTCRDRLVLGGQVADGDGEERSVVGEETSDRDVHGTETADDTEAAANLGEGSVASNVRACQQEEGEGNIGEDKDESD